MLVRDSKRSVPLGVGTRGSPWAQPGAANHEAKPRYGAMESSPRRKSWEEATNESGAPVGGV